MTNIKLKKAMFEDEIWNRIKEALDEHKKGETIKLTPQTLRDISKRQTDWPIDDQSVQKSFTTTGDAPLQSYALLKDKNTEKIPYILYIFYTFANYRRVNNWILSH